MLDKVHRFLSRNINSIVDIILISTILLLSTEIEKLELQYFDNSYYYYLFCYILGFVMYGITFEILSCLIVPRYPSYYNIKRIFTSLITVFSYPSPNSNFS